MAATQTAAVDLWGQHHFDGNEPVAEQWAASARGVMTLAISADLDQRDLEPRAIDWALEPFRYPTNQGTNSAPRADRWLSPELRRPSGLRPA